MENGSGLSRSDRASPRQVGPAPRRDEPRAPAAGPFALAPAGGEQGTVADRMNGTAAEGRCRTKTGTLIGGQRPVGLLPGRPRHGRLLDPDELRERHHRPSAQDKMAALIARYRR